MDVVREVGDGLKPTSMIDISDGLASEVMHLGTSSGVGFKVYEDKLPIDPKVYETAREFNLDLCMLSGGEDYELLFTIKQDDYEKVRNHPADGHRPFSGASTSTSSPKTAPKCPCRPRVGTGSKAA